MTRPPVTTLACHPRLKCSAKWHRISCQHAPRLCRRRTDIMASVYIGWTTVTKRRTTRSNDGEISHVEYFSDIQTSRSTAKYISLLSCAHAGVPIHNLRLFLPDHTFVSCSVSTICLRKVGIGRRGKLRLSPNSSLDGKQARCLCTGLGEMLFCAHLFQPRNTLCA